METEVGAKVPPLVRVKLARQMQPSTLDPVDRLEALVAQGISGELLQTTFRTIVIQLRPRLEERGPGLSISRLQSLHSRPYRRIFQLISFHSHGESSNAAKIVKTSSPDSQSTPYHALCRFAGQLKTQPELY